MKKMLRSCQAVITALALTMISSLSYGQNVGAIYRIVSTNTGKVMTVNGNYALDSYVVMGDVENDNKDQMWALISGDSGESYALFNLASGNCIDMALGSKNPGKLLQWTPNLNNNNQLFTIKSPGIAGSALQILNASGMNMAVTEQADGTLWMKDDLLTTDTYFSFEELVNANDLTIPLPYITYKISPVNGGGVLSNAGINDNDAPIVLEESNDEAYGQMWKLVFPAYQSGTTMWYQLLNVSCGKCIDCAMESGGNPLQWNQHTASDRANWNQMFQILPVEGEDEVYQLMIYYSGTNYYLAVDAEKDVYTTEDGASSDTYFRFTRVSDAMLPQGIYWQDEKVFEENKEPGHATYMPYQSTQAMRADERYNKAWLDPVGSTKWMNLNGTWRLKWNILDANYTMPEEEFYADTVDASTWDEIPVPACLEMHGYGSNHYINVAYAFVDNPPYIAMLNGLYNSVGSYRRNFTLPEGWENERVLLHFDGMYSCGYVWVNGQYVGYTEGANMDAEFDITKYVRTGENNVSVRTIRWTDASYLEGQDMWHMSGLHRDVYLVAVPKVFVRDHRIRTILADNAKSGSLFVDLTLDNRDSLECNKQYEVRLLSPQGEVMETRTAEVSFATTDATKSLTLDFKSLTNLQPWTADQPTLYTVEVVQKNGRGEEESVLATKYGFIKADIKDEQFRINGKRTLLRGVNTQDTHPITGRTMSVEDMWRDLVMMKQNNINHVRTSHYPRSPKMNAMMDYLGIYMMDEADVEAHKNWTDGDKISYSTSWRAAHVDRVTRMVMRDRNHPSVVSWSLGNESGYGYNHQATYDAARALDSRPIHYEGASHTSNCTTDMYSRMYRDVYEIRRSVDAMGKPYYMCEYAHAMGHSVGNLQEYMDAHEASRCGMGGAIWDWVDQAIVDPADIQAGNLTYNGWNRYRNGNDYPGPHQGNFVNNGIITADRGITGKLAEVKRVYQQVAFALDTDLKSLTIENKYEALNIQGMNLIWSLLLEGEQVQTGTITLPSIEAGKTADVSIPYTMEGTGEYMLNVSVALTSPTPWAQVGHIIAQGQFALTERTAMSEVSVAEGQSLTLTRSGNTYTIAGENINMVVNRSKGITMWQMGGMDVIPQNAEAATAPAYSNYRWIENDAPYGTDPIYGTDNGISSRTFSVAQSGGNVVITETAEGRNCNYTFVYTVYPNGTVDLQADYTANTSNLRRIGMLMQLNSEFAYTKYYARGPLDNTIDRKVAADLGVYEQLVKDFHVDYVRPQTSGDRQDVRWVIFHNGEGNGVKIETEGEVHMTVDNYTDAFKHDFLHQWELPVSNDVFVNFDWRQRGIGNGSCGAGVMNEYMLPSSGTYSYRLRFSAVKDLETGITSLPTLDETDSIPAHTPVYNLSGQLVGNTSCISALPAGIYIAGGKRFMVK